jgi:hypothetical protein
MRERRPYTAAEAAPEGLTKTVRTTPELRMLEACASARRPYTAAEAAPEGLTKAVRTTRELRMLEACANARAGPCTHR